MSAHAAPAPGGARTLVIRGKPFPVLLPKVSDPRLHLAVVITSLQVLGQVAFHFRLSIAQILVSLLTCAILEVGIALRRQHVILWPASALLTGNGVAFILRVPGTQHGDWWSLRGWWIFAATAAVSLLSKHLIQWRGGHIFNPSNFGLVLCFLVLGRARAEPLDFWWGPMSGWLVLALLIILAGGFTILGRLKLLWIAVCFWLSFAAGIALLAAAGHQMTARWHLGPISGFGLWWVLVTSPEVLVFLFFMITDPRTAPRAPRARIVYAVAIGLLASLMIAPTRTEWATKVALLLALFVICAARPLIAALPLRQLVRGRIRIVAVAAAAVAYAAVLLLAGGGSQTGTAAAASTGKRLAVTILPSRGVQTQLNAPTAQSIARDLASEVPAAGHESVSLWLERGSGQDPPIAVARLAGRTYRLKQLGGVWTLATGSATPTTVALPRVPVLHGYALANVASQVGVDFTQDSFRFGVTPDPTAMMGGGVCWLDYDNDGWLDLFVVNSYTDSQYALWQDRGGAPTGALFHNVHGRFVNVTKVSGTGAPLRGNGCVAADFDGDGHTDLFVTTATNDVLFWNNGDGTFTEGARKAGVVSFGWHSGAAVADVNGDGRPDLFVAGYANMAEPITSSVKGFPSNYVGVRDELFLNEGGRRFKEVAASVGIDPKPYGHGLGAEFLDVNGDGRPDLYVANDEDPNALYLNEPGGPLGFHFVRAASAYGVADSNAGMGIAASDVTGDGRADLFVTNSRGQGNAAYQSAGGGRFTDVRKRFRVGVNPTGWGDAWIDLRNSGTPELVVANGAIPVTKVKRDAAPLQVLAPQHGRFIDSGLLRSLRVNGRGLAAADFDNDGRVDIAVNTVGGKLLLLHNTSPAGNWLEVQIEPFSPGAVVTAVSSDGRRQVQVVRAGSSYLSSEDPRVHLGFGKATVRSLSVRFPDGTVKTVGSAATNRLLTVQR